MSPLLCPLSWIYESNVKGVNRWKKSLNCNRYLHAAQSNDHCDFRYSTKRKVEK